MRNMKTCLIVGTMLTSIQAFAIGALGESASATLSPSTAISAGAVSAVSATAATDIQPVANSWNLAAYKDKLLNVYPQKDILRIALTLGFGQCKLVPLNIGSIQTYKLVTAKVAGIRGDGLYPVTLLNPIASQPGISLAHGVIFAEGLVSPAAQARVFANHPVNVLTSNVEANAVKSFQAAIAANRCGTATLPSIGGVNYASMSASALKSAFTFYAVPKGPIQCTTIINGPSVFDPKTCKYVVKPIALKQKICERVFKRIAVSERAIVGSKTNTVVASGTIANPLSQPVASLPVVHELTPAIQAELVASQLPHKTLVQANYAAMAPSVLASFPLEHMVPDLNAAVAGDANASIAAAKFVSYATSYASASNVGYDSSFKSELIAISNSIKLKPYVTANIATANTFVASNPGRPIAQILAANQELVKPIKPWIGNVNISQYACPMEANFQAMSAL